MRCSLRQGRQWTRRVASVHAFTLDHSVDPSTRLGPMLVWIRTRPRHAVTGNRIWIEVAGNQGVRYAWLTMITTGLGPRPAVYIYDQEKGTVIPR